jgi:hypothetical protein
VQHAFVLVVLKSSTIFLVKDYGLASTHKGDINFKEKDGKDAKFADWEYKIRITKNAYSSVY